MDNLAVLIPAYNESKTIEKVVVDVINATLDIPGTVVYVYDNNSSDNTAELAEKAGGRLFDMNMSKVKGPLFDGCFEKWMHMFM